MRAPRIPYHMLARIAPKNLPINKWRSWYGEITSGKKADTSQPVLDRRRGSPLWASCGRPLLDRTSQTRGPTWCTRWYGSGSEAPAEESRLPCGRHCCRMQVFCVDIITLPTGQARHYIWQESAGRIKGKGTSIKIITFQKKSNIANNTLFALCLLLKEFFLWALGLLKRPTPPALKFWSLLKS